MQYSAFFAASIDSISVFLRKHTVYFLGKFRYNDINWISMQIWNTMCYISVGRGLAPAGDAQHRNDRRSLNCNRLLPFGQWHPQDARREQAPALRCH